MAVTFQPKSGAKERILKTYPGVHALLDQAANTARNNAYARSVSDGHPCKYNTNHYVDGKGFHHADAFISWKRPSRYYERAVDHLRNSI